jgi:hypothetical protein
MTYKFYRADTIVESLFGGTIYRNALTDYVTDNAAISENFWEIINDEHDCRYTLVSCSPAKHAAIANATNIASMSPEMSDVFAMQTWLSGTHNFTAAQINRLDADGVPMDWVTGATHRDIIRYLMRHSRLLQHLIRERNADITGFIRQSLAATVNQIPVAQRQRIANWMEARGLSTTWISPATTTVRQVVHYIIVNAFPIANNLGPIAL